jgi:hypothetical protein
LAPPRFLSEERDAGIMLKGVRLVRRIMQAIGEISQRGSLRRRITSDEALVYHIRDKADTIYHVCAGTAVRLGRAT